MASQMMQLQQTEQILVHCYDRLKLVLDEVRQQASLLDQHWEQMEQQKQRLMPALCDRIKASKAKRLEKANTVVQAIVLKRC